MKKVCYRLCQILNLLIPDSTANEVTLPQNYRLLKPVSRQLSRRESIYRWLHRPGASAGASPAFLGLSLPYALIRCTHDLTYVRARQYFHAWEYPDDVKVSRMRSRRKCKSTCHDRLSGLGENSILAITVIPPIAPLSARSF